MLSMFKVSESFEIAQGYWLFCETAWELPEVKWRSEQKHENTDL